MLLAGIGFELGLIVGDRKRGPQPTFTARKISFSKSEHSIEADPAPILLRHHVDHQLAQLVFFVDVMDGIDLVDDVDQVP